MPYDFNGISQEDAVRALQGHLVDYDRAARGERAAGKARELTDILGGITGGIKDWVETPADYVRALSRPPEVPGQWSEWDQEHRNQAAQRAQEWGPATALNVLGTSAAGIPRGALGVGGSRVAGPRVAEDTKIPKEEWAPATYSSVAREGLPRSDLGASVPEQLAPPGAWFDSIRNAPGLDKTQRQSVARELDWLKSKSSPPGPYTSATQMREWAEAGQPEVVPVVRSAAPDLNFDSIPRREQQQAIRDYQDVMADMGEDVRQVHPNDASLREGAARWYENVVREGMLDPPNKSSAVKFGPETHPDMSLPGGENYREMVLTLPNHRGSSDLQTLTSGDVTNFKSSHFPDVINPVAHVRMDDRMVPDASGTPKKTLFLQEVQSDWHQQGRKHGYTGDIKAASPDDFEIKPAHDGDGWSIINRSSGREEYAGATKESAEDFVKDLVKAENYRRRNGYAVPDAPFRQSWPDLALKHAVRRAAEEGHDQLAWTTGDTQADRYDLSKHLDSVGYRKRGENLYNVAAYPKKGNGSVWNSDHATIEDIEQNLGKEMAEKISKGEGREEQGHKYLEDLDLKVGGEGMRQFYDKELVNKANALASKYGAKVEQRDMQAGRHELTDPDLEGLEAETPEQAAIIARATRTTAPEPTRVHVLPITPQLREAALRKGFPLFGAAVAAPYVAGADRENDDLVRALSGVTHK